MKKDNYIPEILDDGNVRVTVKGDKCKSCGRTMIKKADYRVYPPYIKHNQYAQLQLNQEVVLESSLTIAGDNICEKCKKEDKAFFTCALCGEKHPSSMIERTIGDAAEYLCTECYASCPAKIWDEKVDELEESHQWDFQ